MSTEDLKQTARRVIDEVWNGRNPDAVDTFYAPEFINHNPDPGQSADRAGLKENVRSAITAFPDLSLRVDDLLAEGDLVVSRWTFTGTHSGPLWGIPATGRSVSFTGVNISRIRDGQCVEEWTNSDTLGMLQQLGVIPSPSAG
jgi:steroid delta-isomerase-like uncharacterized protein